MSNIRRRALISSIFALPAVLTACSKEPLSFQSTDITGASFGENIRLKDHHGQLRGLSDFRGKVTVVFFGFTHCPDVCPTSLTTLAEVKQRLGAQGDKLQVLFITVDPERDTQEMLAEYMKNFDAAFLALRPTPEELKQVAESFKVFYRKVDGPTPTSYTMEHSAGKYIFDSKGRARLFSPYGTSAEILAEDVRKLLATG